MKFNVLLIFLFFLTSFLINTAEEHKDFGSEIASRDSGQQRQCPNLNQDCISCVFEFLSDKPFALFQSTSKAIKSIGNRTAKWQLKQYSKLSQEEKNRKLIKAVRYNQLKTTQLLTQAGADINDQNIMLYGNTALMLAAARGLFYMTKQLLYRGANINLHNLQGETELMFASLKGNLDIARLLLSRGADVHQQNFRGDNALIKAAYAGRQEVVKLLLDHGANIDSQDRFGNAALMLAISIGDKKTAKLLLDRGANIYLPNFYGETVLSLANKCDIPQLYGLFLKHKIQSCCSIQ